MDADQPLGSLAAHRVRDVGAHVAPLGDVARVAEAVHQLRPRACDAAGLPAELGRLAREAVAGQGRQHQVERVLGGAAVSGRVGQRADGVQQLDDRAGPAMRHDQRQRVLMPRPDVDEVDLDPVDLGRELRQRVQSRLAPAPVVLGRPVAGERLQRRQLHALRAVGDELFRRPARRLDPAAKLSELRVRESRPGMDVRRCPPRRAVEDAHKGLLSRPHRDGSDDAVKPARLVCASRPWVTGQLTGRSGGPGCVPVGSRARAGRARVGSLRP